MQQLILFASGKGSNVQAILDYFRHRPDIRIPLIVCNRAGAGVLDIARKENIPYRLIGRADWDAPDFQEEIRTLSPSLLVLAGFLWKVPQDWIEAYPHRWVNLHPALLPRYGGRGMYGHHVHQAVIDSGDRQSGITIHLVDPEYDTGPSLIQAYCPVLPNDDPGSLARRIHQLEHFYYPRCLDFLLGQHEVDQDQETIKAGINP